MLIFFLLFLFLLFSLWFAGLWLGEGSQLLVDSLQLYEEIRPVLTKSLRGLENNFGTTLKFLYPLTCSCSSASLWALSSSESSVEDSDSEEESLELSEDEATGARGG